MSKYFVYFSATGNGDFLATILEKEGFLPVKIEMVKPLKKMNFFRIIKYGGWAMSGKKPDIKEPNLNLNEDDEVVIGSPIWNDRLSSPINTLLAKYKFNLETTKFVLYPAGKTTKKSIKQIAKMGFKLPPVVVPYPKKNAEETEKLLKEGL